MDKIHTSHLNFGRLVEALGGLWKPQKVYIFLKLQLIYV